MDSSLINIINIINSFKINYNLKKDIIYYHWYLLQIIMIIYKKKAILKNDILLI